MADPTPAPAHPVLAEILADLEAFAQSTVGQSLLALLLSKLTPAQTQAVHDKLAALKS